MKFTSRLTLTGLVLALSAASALAAPEFADIANHVTQLNRLNQDILATDAFSDERANDLIEIIDTENFNDDKL